MAATDVNESIWPQQDPVLSAPTGHQCACRRPAAKPRRTTAAREGGEEQIKVIKQG